MEWLKISEILPDDCNDPETPMGHYSCLIVIMQPKGLHRDDLRFEVHRAYFEKTHFSDGNECELRWEISKIYCWAYCPHIPDFTEAEEKIIFQFYEAKKNDIKSLLRKDKEKNDKN